MKRIRKVHQGFLNSNFLAKIIEWISIGCNYNIYLYKKQLPNHYQWKILIKCAIYDSILACINSRYKAIGLIDIFKLYKKKYNYYSLILKKRFNYIPQRSSFIIKNHINELPRIYRIKNKCNKELEKDKDKNI